MTAISLLASTKSATSLQVIIVWITNSLIIRNLMQATIIPKLAGNMVSHFCKVRGQYENFKIELERCFPYFSTFSTDIRYHTSAVVNNSLLLVGGVDSTSTTELISLAEGGECLLVWFVAL